MIRGRDGHLREDPASPTKNALRSLPGESGNRLLQALR